MSASTLSTYGHSLWLTRHSVHFYPTFTYCCHPFFSPSCQPASTQLLLPWRHLISWHMNQSHRPAPPSPSLTNSLFSSSHLSLCSVRVHPVHPFLRTANYLRVAEGSDSVKSLGACRCQHTWLTVTVLVVTCGSDPEIGFITCSLSFTEKKKYESNHGERSNSSNARTIWVSCLFWSAELAYGLNTCRAKAQTCRHRKQIWWTRQQRWHISVGGDWWNDPGA